MATQNTLSGKKKTGPSSANSESSKTVESDHNCPVCLDYLLPPIYQCSNGHVICNQCEFKINNCPVCRDELPKTKKIRCLILEKIVVDLSFNCPNKDQGCQLSLKYNEIQEHKRECQFVELPICSFLGLKCEAKHNSSSILSHLKAKHNLQGINIETQDSQTAGTIKQKEITSVQIQQYVSISKLKRKQKPKFIQHYFLFHDHNFFLTTSYDIKEQGFSWCIFYLQNGQSTSDERTSTRFVARIKLIPKDSEFNFVQWQGEVGELKKKILASTSNSALPGESGNRKGSASSGFKKFRMPLSCLRELCEVTKEQQENDTSSSTIQNSKEKETDEIGWTIELCFKQIKNQNHSQGLVANERKKESVVIKSDVTYLEAPISNAPSPHPAHLVAERLRQVMQSGRPAQPSLNPHIQALPLTPQAQLDIMRRIQQRRF